MTAAPTSTPAVAPVPTQRKLSRGERRAADAKT
jgi:hypothetical protein